ncbi:MAG: hypothetical protein JW795_13715 [Chitinivibrionales bacterium]|nr:hypothetical protein [Chitinivibrionales bacterium]
MVSLYVILFCTLCALFALFLVISKTLNGIISQLAKLEYLLNKECEFKHEEREVQKLLAAKSAEDEEDQ